MVMRWICGACIVFAFFLIGWESLQIMNGWEVVGTIVLGVLFFGQTISYRNASFRWLIWLVAGVWSLGVFTTFVLVAQRTQLSTHNIPTWMQLATPFVFGLVPLVILWGARAAIPTYWRLDQ